jgi:hypothetical protein
LFAGVVYRNCLKIILHYEFGFSALASGRVDRWWDEINAVSGIDRLTRPIFGEIDYIMCVFSETIRVNDLFSQLGPTPLATLIENFPRWSSDSACYA